MASKTVRTEPPLSAPPVDHAPLTRRRGPSSRRVLAIASIGASVAFVDATIVNIAFPSIAKSFPGTPISSLSWVLNAYNIVFAAFLLGAGRIADLVGRRRIFILGLELFTFASLLCAGAPSAAALIGFRVLQALGAALLVPASLALVLNAFPPDQRSHGVALLSAVAAASAGLGPSLGGVLVAIASWRLVFLVNLPIGLAAVLLARRQLVESRTPGRRRIPDLLGALILALGIAALVLGIVKGEEWGWGNVRTLAAFGVAAALVGVFAWRCSWHRSPVVELPMLRNRTFTVSNAMTIVAAAGFYGYTLANVLFLTGVWRYSVLQAGLALTPGPLVAAAVAGPTSRIARRIGYRPVLVAGGLFWGGAVLWLIERVGSTPAFLEQWLPGIVLLGLGAGILFPNLSAAAVASAPGEGFATATGMNAVTRQVGAAFGVAAVVAIIGQPSPLQAMSAFHDAWGFGAACMFTAGLGCLFVGRVSADSSPSLRSAARLLLRETPGASPPTSTRERARRALTLETAVPSSRRVESAEDFLARVPLFAGLERPLLETVARRARSVHVNAGDWLFHEGDDGDAMYVVLAGRLEVVDEAAGVTIRELGRGDVLGELALIGGTTRSASVRAARASDLLAVARADFEELMYSSLELSLSLNRLLAELLRGSRAPAVASRPLPATIALVTLADGVPIADLARRLTGALRHRCAAALFDGSEAAFNGDSAPASVYGPLLDRAEAANDIVVLEGGQIGAGAPWTRFCLQQADRILVLTAGGPPPAALRERVELRGCDLVACDVEAGSGVLEGWAEELQPIETHSLRREHLDADVERAARRLSGHSIGVVLSGGGARAFAHIGALEELVAAGIEIDRVAGVSMGAFVGALFAMGLDADEIDARCFEEWVQRNPLSDYTFPRRSLIRGVRAEAMLRRTFGETAIEELPLSFMCGCTELRSGALVVMRYGPLWERVGFSMCIPVLAPPQLRGRELMIDGSLVDNLPVGTMAALGEGPIIAIDVKASFEPPVDGAPRAGTLGRVPSLGETLTRVLLLGSANTSDQARQYADVLIKPRSVGVGLLEFHQLDAAREAGRVAAHEVLERGLPAALA
jgi:NTE family protein